MRQEVVCAGTHDVHEDTPLDEVADVVSVLQTPAFLCRQTNFIQKVCAKGLPVNIKKGQFLAQPICVTWSPRPELPATNGSWSASGVRSFGYNNLVSDMRALAILRDTDCPSGIRCDAFGADAGRAGRQVRRPAGDGARAGPCGRGCRRFGTLYGNPPRTGAGSVGRPQRMADAMMEDLLRELVELDVVVKRHAFLEDAVQSRRGHTAA